MSFLPHTNVQMAAQRWRLEAGGRRKPSQARVSWVLNISTHQLQEITSDLCEIRFWDAQLMGPQRTGGL